MITSKLVVTFAATAIAAGAVGFVLGNNSKGTTSEAESAGRETSVPSPPVEPPPPPSKTPDAVAEPTPPVAEEPPKAEPAPPPTFDKWIVDKGESAMDDTPGVSLLLFSENEERVNSYSSAKAALIIRCRENQTDLYINFDAFLGSDSIKVRTRIDEEKAKDNEWSISTDHKAAFAPNAIALMKQLARAATYRVRATPYSESPVEYEFDVRGLDKHLPNVADACGWKL